MPSVNTNLFKQWTIVMFKAWNGKDYPAYIESLDNSNERPNEFFYTIISKLHLTPARVREDALRRMTWRECRWFLHPKDRHYMMGRNHWLLGAIVHIGSLCLAVVSFVSSVYAYTDGEGVEHIEVDPAAVAVGFFGLAIIAAFWWASKKQYTGRWV